MYSNYQLNSNKKRSYQELNEYPRDSGHAMSFDSSILRSGKWTVEEEKFACYLIEQFELGRLSDCENGITLRSYLAKKLNCAPMRISKKFAGKCIGKHIFAKRVSEDKDSNGRSFDLSAISSSFSAAIRSTLTTSNTTCNKKQLSRTNSHEDGNTSDDTNSLSDSSNILPNKNTRSYSEVSIQSYQNSVDSFFQDPPAKRKCVETISNTSAIPNGNIKTTTIDDLDLNIYNSYNYFYNHVNTISINNCKFSENYNLSDSPSELSCEDEASEWRDVLSYFCGMNDDLFTNNDNTNGSELSDLSSDEGTTSAHTPLTSNMMPMKSANNNQYFLLNTCPQSLTTNYNTLFF